MGVKEWVGLESDRKVRYGIVGLGDIAQEDLLPGVKHTLNSEIHRIGDFGPNQSCRTGR